MVRRPSTSACSVSGNRHQREMRLSHSTQPHSRWQMSRHIPADTSAHTRSTQKVFSSSSCRSRRSRELFVGDQRRNRTVANRGAGEGFGSILTRPTPSSDGCGCGEGSGRIPINAASFPIILGAGEGLGSMEMRPPPSLIGRGCGDGMGVLPTNSTSVAVGRGCGCR